MRSILCKDRRDLGFPRDSRIRPCADCRVRRVPLPTQAAMSAFKARMFHEGCQATSVSTGMQEPILRRHQPRDGNVNVASAAPAWK